MKCDKTDQQNLLWVPNENLFPFPVLHELHLYFSIQPTYIQLLPCTLQGILGKYSCSFRYPFIFKSRSSWLSHRIVIWKDINASEHLCGSILTLKIEAARSSETLVTYQITTRCHNQVLDLNLHRRENLESSRSKNGEVCSKLQNTIFLNSPASYPMGTRGSFPGGKSAGPWSWPLTSI
jgi:hypothetical protein